MNPSRGDVQGLLREVGRSAAPAPRPEFVESLRAHLVDVWPDRAVPELQAARLSRRELRRMLSDVGATPAPSPAPVETVREGLRNNGASAVPARAPARKPMRARYAAAAAAALIGAAWIGGQVLTNRDDAGAVASGEVSSGNGEGKQKLSSDELDGRPLAEGEKVRLYAPGVYVVRVNGSKIVITGSVEYRDGVVVVDGTPIPVEQPSGDDTQSAAPAEPVIERAPEEPTSSTTEPPTSTTTAVPPTSTTTTPPPTTESGPAGG